MDVCACMRVCAGGACSDVSPSWLNPGEERVRDESVSIKECTIDRQQNYYTHTHVQQWTCLHVCMCVAGMHAGVCMQ